MMQGCVQQRPLSRSIPNKYPDGPSKPQKGPPQNVSILRRALSLTARGRHDRRGPAGPVSPRRPRDRQKNAEQTRGSRLFRGRVRRPNSGAQCCFEVNPCPQPHTVEGNHRKNRRSQRAAAVHFKSSRSGRGRNGAHFTMYLTYLHLELHSDRLAGNCTRFHGVRPHGTNERIYFYFSLSEKTPCVKTKHKNFFHSFYVATGGKI